MYLEKINGPADIKKLSVEQLNVLADETRHYLIEKVSNHGGHVGPNLGMVEATVALHYVFNSPVDKIVFDVSHQSYAHKILTDRKQAFMDPAHYNDVTGFSEPSESEHDHFVIGHTSTSISLKPSLRRQKDQELKRRLLSLHQRYPALGLDSLYHLIRPQLSCSRKRIHRLMNEMNISSTRRRAYKATTNSRHAHPIAPNLLARRFSFDKPDTAWVGDITYIPTGEGWLYCAVVKDLCTKQIVGYAFSDRIDTNLTLAALGMAVRRRKPLPGLIFHSDRGVQYAAYAYRQRLASLGIRQSMSRKGDPYDNAVAENFFSCLKCECVHLRHFASRAHAMADVFAYIETFYNPVRPHSSIGWRPPDAFARALSEHPAA